MRGNTNSSSNNKTRISRISKDTENNFFLIFVLETFCKLLTGLRHK